MTSDNLKAGDLLFGVATSAYQIEGATAKDGRGPGIWDTFAAGRGNIRGGHTADTTCDHYHRYPEDVGLLRQLGIDAYRFSVSWPRLLPAGTGKTNPAGLAFYDRLIDALLEAGIDPWLTMYHWDLPEALQAKGGWTNRDVVDWFGELANLLVAQYADRVSNWIVLNEACMTSHRGHAFGTDAPGIRDRAAFFATIHHQNLAQGRALDVLREHGPDDLRAGTSILLQPAVPATDSDDDAEAARFLDATWNRAALDPLIHGTYPALLADDLEPWIKPGDMGRVRRDIDFLGVNYYVRSFVESDDTAILGLRRARYNDSVAVSPFGMEVFPEGIGSVLVDLRCNYGNPPVFITECGYADTDDMPKSALLDDQGRIDYLSKLIFEVEEARREGTDVRGVFIWSLLDNFEWEFGFWPRFGIVHVDYESQKRTPKSSFYWYRHLIETRRNHGQP